MQSSPALTFDDVLMVPAYSLVVPRDVNVASKITKNISLNIPILAAAMDTVSEDKMAVAMASLGGLAVIHKNNTIEEQVKLVENVKRFESYLVLNPVTITKEKSIQQAIDLMLENNIAGLPVVSKDGKVEGIITNRDIKFCLDRKAKIKDVMTTSVITIAEKAKRTEITALFNKHKIEKLIVVDKNGYCKGLITSKDIQKSTTGDFACRDKMGRLLAAAAVGVSDSCLERAIALKDAEVDLIIVDSAHGHSANVLKRVEKLKSLFGNKIDIIAGNVVTPQAVEDLAKAGADGVKIGIGPGSICTTRVVAGVGYPQLSAVMGCVEMSHKYGVPLIADGGIKTSGDIAKAIAAGASSVMLGSLLAGTDEAPGETFIYQGRSYKTYRGMGSAAAMMKGSADRYFQEGTEQREKLVAEGVEGAVPFKGSIKTVIHQLVGGLKSAMGYTGNKTIPQMQANTKFIQITNAGLAESHTHSIRVTNE